MWIANSFTLEPKQNELSSSPHTRIWHTNSLCMQCKYAIFGSSQINAIIKMTIQYLILVGLYSEMRCFWSFRIQCVVASLVEWIYLFPIRMREHLNCFQSSKGNSLTYFAHLHFNVNQDVSYLGTFISSLTEWEIREYSKRIEWLMIIDCEMIWIYEKWESKMVKLRIRRRKEFTM